MYLDIGSKSTSKYYDVGWQTNVEVAGVFVKVLGHLKPTFKYITKILVVQKLTFKCLLPCKLGVEFSFLDVDSKKTDIHVHTKISVLWKSTLK